MTGVMTKQEQEAHRYATDEGYRERKKANARAAYKRNEDAYKARAAANRAAVTAFVNEVKANGRCMDCKLDWPPCVLQFHHRDPATKKGEVTNRSTVKLAIAEMEKCDLLCANCHLLRHEGTT